MPNETFREMLEALVPKMETQLEQWKARVNELLAEAEEADMEVNLDYRQNTNDLKSRRRK